MDFSKETCKQISNGLFIQYGLGSFTSVAAGAMKTITITLPIAQTVGYLGLAAIISHPKGHIAASNRNSTSFKLTYYNDGTEASGSGNSFSWTCVGC